MKDNKRDIIALLAIILVIAGVLYFNKKAAAPLALPSPEVSDTALPSPSAEVSEAVTASLSPTASAPVNAVKSTQISIGPVTLPAKVFGDNDTIRVVFEGNALIGPVYMYLQNPATKQVFATALVSYKDLHKNGQTSANFDLESTKVPSVIPGGTYRILVCDAGKGADNALCAASIQFTIIDSDVSIMSLSPDSLYPGTDVTLYGTGFDANTYLIIDGAARKDLSLQLLSSTTLQFTLPNSIVSGRHILQIKGTKNIGSNTIGFVVLK